MAGSEYEDAASQPSTPVDDKRSEASADPVVKSCPIFFSPALRNNIILNQYPLRSANRPYNTQTGEVATGVRIKPKTGWMEVDMPLLTSKYYDPEKATRFGSEEQPLNQQVLSSRLQPPATKLMVGVFRNGQLHIVPVRGISQLRPTLRHVDEKSKRARDIANSSVTRAQAPAREPARAVQVTVKQNTEAPKLSTTPIIRATEGEAWVDYSIGDVEGATSLLRQLECPAEHQLVQCTPK
ncbi:DNA-directed RNA polymerase III complex subunit Rpc37 [Schizosaccharomyces japonicus yFS275]|uniref:DNA-directed RNA polymerase III complex subunit Rpc37 n=1 Tax=Schizosaccharomyces japonicus (strain yFS275 / FY16936) TaxID=402676 RepID=B6K5E6_SCHJY|nr:DNA-directed RNA polymerase III complex subunit Rpc37 [Schizosaccharomyces japonicus yFS275]EEB08750.1 DNA-directed RNA polymerase III complex subunit Rpc37 [Schizosaccharomyces japonicus yFS275]